MPDCPIAESHSENGGPFRYCQCGWMEESQPEPADLLPGLRAAHEVVARQADLPGLMHFDRPSDFRKGVLTCLAALDAEITAATPSPESEAR